jgi:threonine dehydratase
MGDTALIRGVASEARRRARGVHIVGVQPHQSPAYVLSWREGRPVETATCDTIADGLAVRHPLAPNVRAIRSVVDETRLVSEDEMLAAMGALLADEHVVAEPSGAAATAALLQDPAAYRGRRVVLLVTGANAPIDVLRRALAAASGP